MYHNSRIMIFLLTNEIECVFDLLKFLENYMLCIAVFETDRSTLAELQYRLLIFSSDAVSFHLVSLTLSDVLGQTEEVGADGDLLDVGQHEASIAGQSYWHRI